VAGPVGAPLLLFLHGFPEGLFIWDEVITRFAATHRCVAPALRGYPGSYTPTEVKAYRAHEVVADLLALIRLQAPTPDTPAPPSSAMTGAAPSPGRWPRWHPRPCSDC